MNIVTTAAAAATVKLMSQLPKTQPSPLNLSGASCMCAVTAFVLATAGAPSLFLVLQVKLSREFFSCHVYHVPFWYLLTRVVPDIFQKSSKTVVCVCVKHVTAEECSFDTVRGVRVSASTASVG